ncbi:MAG: lactate utilization protein, partial [Desulfobacterales bacterium]|nr:lactate utilization protein [Desulfobacterales bacterium]
PEYGTEKKVAAWRHPLIDRLDIVSGLAEADIPLVLPPEGDLASEFRAAYREEVAGAFVGITAADYCVAETATLTMKNISGHPRIVSLLPVIHVGVVTLDQLVENLSELYFRLQWDPEEAAAGIGNGMTFISGPSKTGDIELVMVHGAHGPRELHLYVVTGDAE